MTIPDQGADAGVLQTAAAIGFEPKPTGSDTDHDALKETKSDGTLHFDRQFCDAPVDRLISAFVVDGTANPLFAAEISVTFSA